LLLYCAATPPGSPSGKRFPPDTRQPSVPREQRELNEPPAANVRHDVEETLAEAVSLLETTPARYELALALADLCGHLRRAGRNADARVPLRRALDLAQRIGAAPLAALTRQQLIAAGARPRRTVLTGPEALTSTERRVAALAADGLSNRQIAEHLFITQPDVETHLRHAVQKLGITSRGLPSRLATEVVRPAGSRPNPSRAGPPRPG